MSGRAGPGVPRDYGSLLVPWGAADIFFPTDFEALGRLYAASAAHAAAARSSGGGSSSSSGGGSKGGGRRGSGPAVSYRHLTTAQFVQALGLSRHTQTLSGWNPLLQDFTNTRVGIASTVGGGSRVAR